MQWKQWQSLKDKDSATETVEVTKGQERTQLWKQSKSPQDKKGLSYGNSGSHHRTRKDSATETVVFTKGKEKTHLWKKQQSPKDKTGLIH